MVEMERKFVKNEKMFTRINNFSRLIHKLYTNFEEPP